MKRRSERNRYRLFAGDSPSLYLLQYGRNALEIVMKSIVKLDSPLVSPPSDFKGDFFKGVSLFAALILCLCQQFSSLTVVPL